MREFIESTIRELGTMAQEYARNGVTKQTKANPTDFVTEADKALSKRFLEIMKQRHPTDQIISEEEDSNDDDSDSGICWIIDPIDGTANFASGIPTWAVMIARQESGKTTHAAVYFPDGDQLFYADATGAYRNGTLMTPATKPTLEYTKGVCSVTPNYQTGVHHPERFRHVLKKLADTDVKLASYRAAATACYVASGALDFWVSNMGFLWDTAAPIYICQQAGLTVTDSDGNAWDGKRDDMVIANNELHTHLMNLFA